MQLDIGQKIRELRRRDGRTQEELAQAIGVTSQAVSRWESGGSYPDMEIIPSIANYFGVSIDELFGYDNERSRKIDALVLKIDAMNAQNNGENVALDYFIFFRYFLARGSLERNASALYKPYRRRAGKLGALTNKDVCPFAHVCFLCLKA